MMGELRKGVKPLPIPSVGKFGGGLCCGLDPPGLGDRQSFKDVHALHTATEK